MGKLVQARARADRSWRPSRRRRSTPRCCRPCRNSSPAGAAPRSGNGPVPVTVAQARIGDVPIYLEGVGTAKARNTVTVRPQVDGRILSINFKEGQDVKRGDVLVKIDPSTYQAQLDQAAGQEGARRGRARQRRARPGALHQARRQHHRPEDHRHPGRAGRQAHRADQARRRRHRQRQGVPGLHHHRRPDRRPHRHPHGRRGQPGARRATPASSSSPSCGPSACCSRCRSSSWPRCSKAQAKGVLAVEALDADGKSALDRGTLQVVDNQVDPTTGTVRMKAEFPNANLQLWPGQFVNVRVADRHARAGRGDPDAGRAEGPQRHLRLRAAGRRPRGLRPVTVAHQSETQAVIAKGIDAGDQVVTTGFSRLKDGASVSVATPEEQAPAADSRTAERREGRRARRQHPGRLRRRHPEALRQRRARQGHPRLPAGERGRSSRRRARPLPGPAAAHEADAGGRRARLRKADAG